MAEQALSVVEEVVFEGGPSLVEYHALTAQNNLVP